MAKRIVYVKIPIIIETNSHTVNTDIHKKFGKNIFAGLNYLEDISPSQFMKALVDQFEIIKEIQKQ